MVTMPKAVTKMEVDMGDSHDDLVFRACLMKCEELESQDQDPEQDPEVLLDWLQTQAVYDIVPGYVGIPRVEWDAVMGANDKIEARL